MPKTNVKTKGHRFEKVRYHVPFYTTPFFKPGGELEEGEIAKSTDVVKLPTLIHTDRGESRANTTYVEMMGITHFDNNVENVLESLWQLNERIIKQSPAANDNEKVKLQWKMMQLICNKGTASSTLQEACKTGRQYVYDQHLADYVEAHDNVTEEILLQDQSAFYEYLERDFEDLDAEEFENTEAFTAFLYEEFNRAAWNYLNSIIFGADAYRAFKQQKDYMTHHLVKPFGVTVEAAFRRVEIMCNLMTYFPAPCSRGKTATATQWDNFKSTKKISNADKREMKYNLLPDIFHDKFDEAEGDWTEMSSTKFLAEAQKFEANDAKERLKMAKAKEALKRKKKEDTDSVSTLSRSQKSDNSKHKNAKKARFQKDPTAAGVARECELCKLAGAPSYVYTNHLTKNCFKKDAYKKSLSGGAGNRLKTSNEYRRHEKQLRRELKLLTKLSKKKKKLKRDADGDADMSSVSSSDSTNVSY